MIKCGKKFSILPLKLLCNFKIEVLSYGMEGAYSARSERATAWLIGAWGFPQPCLTALTQETFLITRLPSGS